MDSESDYDENQNKDYYYRGKIIRTPKWKNLHKEVLEQLQQHTVLLFLTCFTQTYKNIYKNDD